MDGNDIPDTRTFVSGLPPHYTSSQLRAHFAAQYQITDAVVIPNRRIGFVGFRSHTLAKSAIKYFDRTYIRLSRISVGLAKPIEIERTATSQAVPKSNRPGQDKVRRPAPLDSNPIKQRASVNGVEYAAASESLAPGRSSKKRKHDDGMELPGDSTTISDKGLPVSTASEAESGPGNFTSKKAEAGDGRRAKQEEWRNRKGLQANTKTSKVGKTFSKEEESKASSKAEPEHHNHDLSATDSSHGQENTVLAESKSKKKGEKDASHFKAREHVDQGAEKSNPQVLYDAEGGVGHLDDKAAPIQGEPADLDQQHRHNVTSANDSEWLRAKTSRLLDLVDDDKPNDISASSDVGDRFNEPAALHQQNITPISSPKNPLQPDLASTRRIFVRNLPYLASESDIKELFSKYGHCDEVHLVRDKADNSKGIGYVRFSDHGDAERALKELDGTSFQGRLLHLLEAVEKRSHKLDDYQISKLPLKKQKILKRRIAANGSTFSWNSMYMNPDAVLSSVADRLGVAKADLMDASSSEAAVRQAHAEAHVIQETKAFFASSGVDLEALEHHDRDASTLLVKNFPFGTTAGELNHLFGTYGDVVRCLIPPSGTIAIIQYGYSSEGSQALRHLAYRNFKGSVLYLEKAPRGLFCKHSEQSMLKGNPGEVVGDLQEKPSLDVVEGTSSTLFVRNLNFSTTSSGLADAFRPLNGFLSAKVKTKVEPKRPHEVLSMGFGFVEFRSDQQAQAAHAAMNGRQLDDHKLVVQFSRKATNAAEEQRRTDDWRKKEAHKTKIIIKNLPFEATKKDVRALLGAYGQLRSVKVPQKFDRSTRGFAFADFVTAKEAANALQALRDTHLLGRRLVMEFAQDETVDPEDEILGIESKVGRQTDVMHFNKMTGSGRKPFNVGAHDD